MVSSPVAKTSMIVGKILAFLVLSLTCRLCQKITENYNGSDKNAQIEDFYQLFFVTSISHTKLYQPLQKVCERKDLDVTNSSIIYHGSFTTQEKNY